MSPLGYSFLSFTEGSVKYCTFLSFEENVGSVTVVHEWVSSAFGRYNPFIDISLPSSVYFLEEKIFLYTLKDKIFIYDAVQNSDTHCPDETWRALNIRKIENFSAKAYGSPSSGGEIPMAWLITASVEARAIVGGSHMTSHWYPDNLSYNYRNGILYFWLLPPSFHKNTWHFTAPEMRFHPQRFLGFSKAESLPYFVDRESYALVIDRDGYARRLEISNKREIKWESLNDTYQGFDIEFICPESYFIICKKKKNHERAEAYVYSIEKRDIVAKIVPKCIFFHAGITPQGLLGRWRGYEIESLPGVEIPDDLIEAKFISMGSAQLGEPFPYAYFE